MKVLFDHQIFCIQRYGGASRYFTELLKQWPHHEWETTIRFAFNEHLIQSGLLQNLLPLPKKYFKGKALLLDHLNRPYTKMRLEKGNYDVFHQTFFGGWCFNALPQDKPMVITFHDMTHARYASLFSANKGVDPRKIIMLQRQSLDRADRIVAVSQLTKNDLTEMWGIDPDKIKVIYHGIDTDKLEFIDNNRILDYPYVLFVGERQHYKNFERFIMAMVTVLQKNPLLRIVCTGKKLNANEMESLNKLGISNQTVHIEADEWTLKRLYRDAELFVFPSYSEGFGMPILEAMLQGCPVALSRASCFPEVAGDAGVYFDPFQVDDMSHIVTKILEDKALRRQMIEQGNERVKLFSWKKTAAAHKSLYEELS